MTEQARKFAEMLSADEALQAELTEAVKGAEGAELIPQVIEFAHKKGIDLTKEDLVPDDRDIDPDELDTIAGAGGCGCAAFGGGSGDGLKCSCIAIGGGNVKINGKTVLSQGGCGCPAVGVGATRRH